VVQPGTRRYHEESKNREDIIMERLWGKGGDCRFFIHPSIRKLESMLLVVIVIVVAVAAVVKKKKV
jgi:hypothetical protein